VESAKAMARTPLFRWVNRLLRQAVQTQPELMPSAENGICRREFLKRTAGATLAVASFSLLDGNALAWSQNHSLQAASAEFKGKRPSIAIVGGGLGGLVTAYRFMQQGLACDLYEGSQRAGGRVFTRSDFNSEGMFVELGGELVDTGHTDLQALCRELHVPLEPFILQEPGLEPALFYSGGKIYTETQVADAFQKLAQVLADDLKRCFPDGNIQVPTYQEPAHAAWLDQISLADYLASHQRKGLVQEWLVRLLRAAYTGEYGLEPEEQSALNLVLLIGVDSRQGFKLFGESDEAMRVKGGNSRLVEALLRVLQPHVPIHYGHRLSRLSLRAEAPQLAGHDAHTPKTLHLGMKVGSHFRWIAAPMAVLALPFSILRTVSGVDAIGLSAVKLRCIREWGYGTNSKQMIGFRSRFWRKSALTSDLSGSSTAHIPAFSGELITDLPAQCYWDTSRLQPGHSGILTNFTGGHAGKIAGSDQWRQVFAELKPLFGDLTDAHDGNQTCFNWSKHRWVQGSYSCPRPGQYTSLLGSAHLPELQGKLFFAGEHCSLNFSGFMNGAVESGNTAALQIMRQLSQSAQAAVNLV